MTHGCVSRPSSFAGIDNLRMWDRRQVPQLQSCAGGMAALLLSGAGMLHVHGDAAAPGGFGDWCWCDACRIWVCGAWEAHEAGGWHLGSLRLIEVHVFTDVEAKSCAARVHYIYWSSGQSLRFLRVGKPS